MAAIADKLFPTSNDMLTDESKPVTQGTGTPLPELGSASTMPAEPTGTPPRGDDMLGRVVQGAHQTIDRLAETAAPHVQRLQERAGSRAGHVKEIGDEWAESVRCTVRDNPLAAVATALALGVLIARLTQR